MKTSALVRYAWTVLAFNVVVILVGAWVRATGSGAGCGPSWPTCRGQLVPEMGGATTIEFTHRLASGVALIAVLVLAVEVFRNRRGPHPARRFVVWSGIAILGEALIGAVIVLAEWVADDASAARAVSVPLHLVNTFLLLAALTLVIFHLSREVRTVSLDAATWWIVGSAGVIFLLISATGAITALADTLFPKDAFGGVGVEATEHFLTRLRVVHPILAVASVVVALAIWARSGAGASRAAMVIVVLATSQIGVGVLNVFLDVPLVLQLLHLLLADLMWIALVWYAAEKRTEPLPAEGLVELTS